MRYNGFSALDPECTNEKLTSLIDCLRTDNGGAYQDLQVVLEEDVGEKPLKLAALVEDAGSKDREFNYTDFLCHLHKLIREKA